MEERMKILEMLANGTISVDEANDLLSTIDVPKKNDSDGKNVNLLKKETAKTLHIKVLSADGDKVNVNIPVAFLKATIKSGNAVQILGKAVKSDAIENIDLEMILASIESGQVGKIVEVQSAGGDFVDIYIE